MADDTQMLRAAQANLIAQQAIHIAKLEARLALSEKVVAECQKENKALKEKLNGAVRKVEVQA